MMNEKTKDKKGPKRAKIPGYFAIVVISLLAIAGIRYLLCTVGLQIEFDSSLCIEIVVLHFTIVFLTTSLLSILAEKNDSKYMIYDKNIIQDRLTEPPYRDFRSLSVYSFLTLAVSVVGYIIGDTAVVIEGAAVGIILIVGLFLKMISVFYCRERIRKKIIEEFFSGGYNDTERIERLIFITHTHISKSKNDVEYLDLALENYNLLRTLCVYMEYLNNYYDNKLIDNELIDYIDDSLDKIDEEIKKIDEEQLVVLYANRSDRKDKSFIRFRGLTEDITEKIIDTFDDLLLDILSYQNRNIIPLRIRDDYWERKIEKIETAKDGNISHERQDELTNSYKRTIKFLLAMWGPYTDKENSTYLEEPGKHDKLEKHLKELVELGVSIDSKCFAQFRKEREEKKNAYIAMSDDIKFFSREEIEDISIYRKKYSELRSDNIFSSVVAKHVYNWNPSGYEEAMKHVKTVFFEVLNKQDNVDYVYGRALFLLRYTCIPTENDEGMRRIGINVAKEFDDFIRKCMQRGISSDDCVLIQKGVIQSIIGNYSVGGKDYYCIDGIVNSFLLKLYELEGGGMYEDLYGELKRYIEESKVEDSIKFENSGSDNTEKHSSFLDDLDEDRNNTIKHICDNGGFGPADTSNLMTPDEYYELLDSIAREYEYKVDDQKLSDICKTIREKASSRMIEMVEFFYDYHAYISEVGNDHNKYCNSTIDAINKFVGFYKKERVEYAISKRLEPINKNNDETNK